MELRRPRRGQVPYYFYVDHTSEPEEAAEGRGDGACATPVGSAARGNEWTIDQSPMHINLINLDFGSVWRFAGFLRRLAGRAARRLPLPRPHVGRLPAHVQARARDGPDHVAAEAPPEVHVQKAR